MISRTKYLDEIVPFIGQKLVKVLIGVRRSGKTVLLSQVKELLLSQGTNQNNIIDINFESLKYAKLHKTEAFYKYACEKAEKASGKVYFFFDEIQEADGWEKVVNSLMVDFDCDIFITGSNSNLLSGELATYLSGRYVEFRIYPFSFKEIKELAEKNDKFTSNEQLFRQYLEFGGLPQQFALNDNHSVSTYIEDVFEAIVIKDVIARNKIKDIDLLRRLLSFLLNNVGNTFSARSICRTLKSENRNTSVDTVLNYVGYLKNAMIICVANRYDIKGKNFLSTLEKYYAIDIGLRNVVKSSEQIDYSKLYENIVYLEMLSRGYEVTVGKLDDQEIDFICYKGSDKIYIQVAYLLDENSTQREFGNLESVGDNFPKYVISSDLVDKSKNGIKHYNIIDFLLEDN